MARYSLWVDLADGGDRVTLSEDVQQEQIGPFVAALSKFPLSGPIDLGITITPDDQGQPGGQQATPAAQQTPHDARQQQPSVMQGGRRRTQGVGQ